MVDRQALEVSLNEAIALAYYIRVGECQRLRVRLMDAIIQMEEGVSSPFSVQVCEEECWLIDSILKEDSKDLTGTSLRPLLRRVWRLIIAWHEHELLTLPDLPLSKVQDKSYQQRLKEVGKDGRDYNSGEDDSDALPAL
jgi:hypothetical protein